jgi:CheY-like chemotaxis protein
MEKKKVLVIDDEEDFLKITELNLEATGKYKVMTSPSAKEIISYVHTFKPDVILLDILMPGLGGIEACEMLNKDAIGRGIPIVILSALDKDQDKLRAFKVGVVDYLAKPIDKNVLIAKIEKALRFKE